MALATLSQLKIQLGISPSETSLDTKLTLFLDAGSDWVESYCDRIFTERSYNETFDGNRSNALIPRQWPITDVTELRISSTRDFSGSDSLVDDSDYGISSDQLTIEYYAGYLPRGKGNIKLIYVAGYATIPRDLVLANLWASEWFYRHNQRGDMGRTNIGKGGESVGILSGVPPMIKSILAPYRRMELASSPLSIGHQP